MSEETVVARPSTICEFLPGKGCPVCGRNLTSVGAGFDPKIGEFRHVSCFDKAYEAGVEAGLWERVGEVEGIKKDALDAFKALMVVMLIVAAIAFYFGYRRAAGEGFFGSTGNLGRIGPADSATAAPRKPFHQDLSPMSRPFSSNLI